MKKKRFCHFLKTSAKLTALQRVDSIRAVAEYRRKYVTFLGFKLFRTYFVPFRCRRTRVVTRSMND